MKKVTWLAGITLGISACSVPVMVINGKTEPFPYRDSGNDIPVLGWKDTIPTAASLLGTTTIHIPYSDAVDLRGKDSLTAQEFAKAAAKRLNGNLIRVTKQSETGDCLEAEIYLAKDHLSLPGLEREDSTTVSARPTTSGNCIVHLKCHLSKSSPPLRFNDSILVESSWRIVTRRICDLTFPTRGILSIGDPGEFLVQGFLLQSGHEYYMHVRYSGFLRYATFKIVNKDKF